jgi:hypothetical protein
MPSNTSILTNLVEVVGNYVSAISSTGISTFVTQDDYRIIDEDADGVLGRHIPVPCAIVSCQLGASELPENPCINADVTVLVRHSMEVSTVAVHQAAATAVFDGLFDQAALFAYIGTDGRLVCADVTYGSQSFNRNNRALETSLTLNITVGSVST